MIPYKTPKADLEKCTRIFLLLGLVVSMLIAQLLVELKSKVTIADKVSLTTHKVIYDEEFIPETNIEPIKPDMTAPVVPQTIVENIKVVSDDKKIIETILSSTEVEEKQKVVVQKVEIPQVKEEKVEEDVVEDVPFFIIEDVPKYPGCEGSKDELKECMQQKIQEFVSKNFDSSIAQELGLEPGTKRIFVTFIIDKNGKISNIESRAPHKSLQAEAERVIKALPQMESGKQRGKPVRVKYSLPIVFQVMEN